MECIQNRTHLRASDFDLQALFKRLLTFVLTFLLTLFFVKTAFQIVDDKDRDNDAEDYTKKFGIEILRVGIFGNVNTANYVETNH